MGAGPALGEDPEGDRAERVEALLRTAVGAAMVSAYVAMIFIGHNVADRLELDDDAPVRRVVMLVVIGTPIWLAAWLGRLANERIRRLGLRGDATVGRVCGELIALVLLLGAPACWTAAEELHLWWTYLKMGEQLDYFAFLAAVMCASACCVVGIAWALCRQHELPRMPLFPEGDDD